MLVMDIERPVNRAQEARLALIDPLGQGMIEEEGLDNLDLVLAKIDQVAKLQKPRIAKTMDFVMVMASDRQYLHLGMSAPDGGGVRGVRQFRVADPQIVKLASVEQVGKRLKDGFVLPGAQRVDQERLLVEKQV